MNLLVRAPNWIGDCVMAVPAIHTLCAGKKFSSVTLAVRRHLAPVFKETAGIDRIIDLEPSVSLRTFYGSVKKMAAARCSQGVLFTNSFESALMLRLAGIRELTGYRRDGRAWLLKNSLNYPVPYPHQIDFYLKLVSKLIPPGQRPERIPELTVTGAEKKSLREKVGLKGVNIQAPWLTLSPWAGYGSAKEWGIHRFSDLIRKLLEWKPEIQILLLGSSADKKKGFPVPQKHAGHVFNLAGELTLRESMTAIALSRVMVGNDSGMLHVASALSVPLAGIFGPTLPQKAVPRHGIVRIFHRPVNCSPCSHRVCPRQHECMDAVKVSEVFAGVREMFSEKSP